MNLVKRAAFPLTASAMILFSSGCANIDASKTTQGTVAGAVAGAAIGAQAGGVRGAVVGAVIGGVIGNQIGSYLDEQDKKKLAELELKALKTGQEQSFVANKSKEKVTITPGAIQKETIATYVISPNVSNYPLTVASRIEIDAIVDTPVYGDTDTKKSPRLVLKKGEKIVVPATVDKNDKWGAVIEGDTVVGYVPVSFLSQKTAKAYVPPKAAATKVAAAKKTSTPAPAVIAAEKSNVPAPTVVAAVPSEPQLQKASVVGNCKINVIRVKDTKENIKWCQEPPSGWKQVQA